MKTTPFVILICSILLLIITSTPLSDAKSFKIYVPPPKELIYFTFGFESALSSAMWIRLLQDIDICDQDDGERAVNLADNLDDLLETRLEKPRCSSGWVYTMIDRITDLNPQFIYAYTHGGMVLSVLVDDRVGAKNIFDKGLKIFPDDYHLVYSAAYHYLYEIQDAGKAAELMLKAHKLGGPDWMVSLAARLYSKANMDEVGKIIIMDFIKTNPNSIIVEALKKRLENMD